MIQSVIVRSYIVKQFPDTFFLSHIYFCFRLMKYTYVNSITFISNA